MEKVGEILMPSLTRRRSEISLGDLEDKIFAKADENNYFEKHQSLHPTSDAASLHSLRNGVGIRGIIN